MLAACSGLLCVRDPGKMGCFYRRERIWQGEGSEGREEEWKEGRDKGKKED